MAVGRCLLCPRENPLAGRLNIIPDPVELTNEDRVFLRPRRQGSLAHLDEFLLGLPSLLFFQSTGFKVILDSTLPELGSAAEIPDSFEDFWEQERLSAFEQLVKEEQLDAEKLRKVIDRFAYSGEKPLPDPDIVELIERPLKLAERGPTKARVLERVVDFVETFIKEIAA